MLPMGTRPDQQPARWDHHVLVYEEAFEPFTLQFAHAAISALELAAVRAALCISKPATRLADARAR